MKNFADFLKEEKNILHCGATGTELMKRGGITPGGISNLTHRELVKEIQKEYVDVGAKILLTCTFSMNEIYAANHAKGYDWAEINKAGVIIAKEAADGKAYVLGNMGPTGELMEPVGTLNAEKAESTFAAQAQILADCGVDGFSVQTFYDLAELKAAIKGIRSVSTLPIMASIVLQQNGATFMGLRLEKAYEELMPLGIQCLGHNCGDIDAVTLGDIMAPLVKSFKIPIMACINAGLPKVKNGETYYDMNPQEFATGIQYLKNKGICVLGGCCGAGKDHIAAASQIL
ncbi:MAG: homocysteine S-methyltransferase family protein [Clostridiales bacterium]